MEDLLMVLPWFAAVNGWRKFVAFKAGNSEKLKGLLSLVAVNGQ